MNNPIEIYSIGHSNKSRDEFIKELKAWQVKTLVDVRSKPYSRFLPHFRKENLKETLENEGIRYWFCGKKLGGYPNDETVFKKGKPDYRTIMKKEWFKEGLNEVMEPKHHPAALMCAEKDPLKCHRFYLISEALREEGIEVFHILAADQCKNHSTLRKGMTLP